MWMFDDILRSTSLLLCSWEICVIVNKLLVFLCSLSLWKDLYFVAYNISAIEQMHVGIFLSAATAKVCIVVDLLAEASGERDASYDMKREPHSFFF